MATRTGRGAPGATIDLCVPWADPRRPDDPPKSHREWAEHIARLIARVEGFGTRSQQADDLAAVAVLVLVRIAPRFDPTRVPPGGSADGLFRGWAHATVRKECQREAIRLRNGGTFNTSASAAANRIKVAPIPTQTRCPNCRDVTDWGADTDGDDDVNAWLRAHGYT